MVEIVQPKFWMPWKYEVDEAMKPALSDMAVVVAEVLVEPKVPGVKGYAAPHGEPTSPSKIESTYTTQSPGVPELSIASVPASAGKLKANPPEKSLLTVIPVLEA